MTNKAIAVGLSGGVDSAVAALLLKQEGFDVHGIFMKNWDEDDDTEYCTAKQDFEDSQRIADTLDIPLTDINFASEYWDTVFQDFLTEYAAGRTPNPDVLCNRNIKFAVFQDYAETHGLHLIATGHYANLQLDGERLRLFRAKDLNKDQTYFLQAVALSRLARGRFPLASLLKSHVRQIARENGLHVFDKQDSTGICFIGERRFREFLGRYLPQSPGLIVDSSSRVLGEHIGLPYYTLGQRQGLGIGGKKTGIEAPWYVYEKRQSSNELVVTQNEKDLESTSLVASEVNFFHPEDSHLDRCQAMVRYRTHPKACSMTVTNDEVHLTFDEPQRAITPGQYVALYDGNECLGGAKINSVTA